MFPKIASFNIIWPILTNLVKHHGFAFSKQRQTGPPVKPPEAQGCPSAPQGMLAAAGNP